MHVVIHCDIFERVIIVLTPIEQFFSYHYWCCRFDSRSGSGVQHYVIKFASDLQQVSGFLRFPPPLELTHRHLFHSKKICPPPLPYVKVNIYAFPLPHFASIFFAYLWSFRWPNSEIFLFSTATFKYIYRAPPQTNWTRIVSERGLVKILVIEMDTATSGPV